MNPNDRARRTFARLSPRLALGLLGAAALASVACGGDDDRAAFEQEMATDDGGTSSPDPDAGTSSFDASTSSADAATSRSVTDAAPGLTTDASPIGIVVDVDSGACRTLGGIFSLTAPTKGSSLLCPTESVICSVTVAASDCKVTTVCHAQDGGAGALLRLLSIPVEVVGPNNDIDYGTSLPVSLLGVDAGSLGFDCAATFGDDSVSLGVSCTATAPILGTVDVCAYAALPVDGGL